MKRLLLLIVVMLVPGWAWAETLYVRPAGGAYGAEDGSSYANAFDGFADIAWGAGAGSVSAGDTLYVCGAHTEKLSVGVQGTSGNQVVIDGGCPDEAGTIVVGGTATQAISLVYTVSTRFITIQNFTLLSGGTSGTVHCNSAEIAHQCQNTIIQDNIIACTVDSGTISGISIRGPRGVTITRNTITGNSGACGFGIKLDTAVTGVDLTTLINNTISYNTVSDFGNAGIAPHSGPSAPANIIPGPTYVYNNTVYNNGDGIYVIGHDKVEVYNNVSHDNNRTNKTGEGYCYASTWANLAHWHDNIGYNCRSKGIEVYADNSRALTGVNITRNFFYNCGTSLVAFRACIHVSNNGAAENWTNVLVSNNYTEGGSSGIQIHSNVSGIVFNNTIVNPIASTPAESCLFFLTPVASSGLTFANNACYMVSGNALYGIYQSQNNGGSATITNNFFDVSTITSNLIRINTTDYTSSTVTSIDANAVVGTSQFVNPTTRDFRTKSNSTLRRAGTANVPACRDVRNRPCWSPPDIGAYQATSGDPAKTRTTR